MAEDDPDFDDEDPFMKEWREKRMMEVAKEAAKPKFGSVYEINKPEWEAHVTNAPAESNVIIHLYQEYVVECKVLNECLNTLANKHKDVKFIKCMLQRQLKISKTKIYLPSSSTKEVNSKVSSSHAVQSWVERE